MNTCFFVSDLHGKMSRYEALSKLIRKERPDFVFLGGDLLPHKTVRHPANIDESDGFITDFLFRKFKRLKEKMECAYPEVYLIPGNDDHKILFNKIVEGEKEELWCNLHNRCIVIGKYRFYGYACVPPTPFMIKDWERFDISPDVGPGCISPAKGYYSVPPDHVPEKDTIQKDLQLLINTDNLEYGIFLFHSPPYQTFLDHAEIRSDSACSQPSGINAGSKAIREFIEEKQPYITMHGHIHETVRLSGQWKQAIGRTWAFSAAHDGPELAVITFELHDALSVTRRIIKT